MTPTALKTLRHSLTDCELVLFADIGSRTVLAANGRLTYPQEVLDGLTACAAEVLTIAPFGAATASDRVILHTPTGVRAFLRAPGVAAEALCFLFAPTASVDGLAQAIARVDPNARPGP